MEGNCVLEIGVVKESRKKQLESLGAFRRASWLIYFLCLLQLMQIMIKVSDVSNEARPMEVAEPWLDCLLQEFFIQVGLIKM